MTIQNISFAAAAAVLAVAVAGPVAAESSLGETYEGTHMVRGPNQPYDVTPPLSDAAIEKRKQGYWGGSYGQAWVTPGKDEIASLERRRRNNQDYVVNPALSDATIEKRKQGYWGGPYGNVWVTLSAAEISALEERRTGRNVAASANQASNQ